MALLCGAGAGLSPCPNLGTGANFHGVCTIVERMDCCTEIVLNIISCTQSDLAFSAKNSA
ncbi:MAG: hypothetical protein ACLVJH_12055 [Faecalibacterium prausnitzii]